jgi:hypothetical protein
MTPDNSLWYRMLQQRHSVRLAEAIREAHEILKQDLLDPEFSEEDIAFLKELKVRA